MYVTNKKFLELIACFPLKRHGQQRKLKKQIMGGHTDTQQSDLISFQQKLGGIYRQP
jgi:hypothetical protein